MSTSISAPVLNPAVSSLAAYVFPYLDFIRSGSGKGVIATVTITHAGSLEVNATAPAPVQYFSGPCDVNIAKTASKLACTAAVLVNSAKAVNPFGGLLHPLGTMTLSGFHNTGISGPQSTIELQVNVPSLSGGQPVTLTALNLTVNGLEEQPGYPPRGVLFGIAKETSAVITVTLSVDTPKL